MTLYEFKVLEEKEQSQMIWSAGVEIARRKDKSYEYILSQIDLFYVEEKNDIQRHFLKSLKSFLSTEPLDLY